MIYLKLRYETFARILHLDLSIQNPVMNFLKKGLQRKVFSSNYLARDLCLRGVCRKCVSAEPAGFILCLRYTQILNLSQKNRPFQSVADSNTRAPTRTRQMPRFFLGWPWWTTLFWGLSASYRAAIPRAKATRNWSSASLVKFVSKSKASNYFAVFLRCSLVVGLKRLELAARGVKRVIHGAEQRQIAQQGTTVDVAMRKDVAAHH